MRRGESSYPETLADVGRLLSCEVRMEVFISTLQSSMTVCALAEQLSLDPPLVSTHLGILRRAGLLTCTSDQRLHIYSAGPLVRVRSEGGLVTKMRARDGTEVMFKLATPEGRGRAAGVDAPTRR